MLGLISTFLLLFILILIVMVILPFVAIVRSAINNDIGNGQKIFWILFMLLTWMFGAMLYCVFVDKNKFLKFIGIIGILVTLAGGYFYMTDPEFKAHILSDEIMMEETDKNELEAS